jgi:hypothetical protein
MRRPAAALAALAVVAGCGGATTPELALLTTVGAHARSITFTFESKPREVSAHYVRRAQLAECGSGARVPLKGGAFLAVHFRPAATAEAKGDALRITYAGPKRLPAAGPLLEAVKTCDFEADVGWTLGVERRLPFRVSRDGASVTVSFG